MWLPRALVAAGLLVGAWTGSAPDDLLLLLQGRVAVVDRTERTLAVDVYLEGTNVPRPASRTVIVPFDDRTRFGPAPSGLDDVRPGDDVLVRVAGDGRANEVTLIDVD